MGSLRGRKEIQKELAILRGFVLFIEENDNTILGKPKSEEILLRGSYRWRGQERVIYLEEKKRCRLWSSPTTSGLNKLDSSERALECCVEKGRWGPGADPCKACLASLVSLSPYTPCLVDSAGHAPLLSSIPSDSYNLPGSYCMGFPKLQEEGPI